MIKQLSQFRRVVKIFLLRAQRFNFALPRTLRRILHSAFALLTKDDVNETDVQDWSTPLLSGSHAASARLINPACPQISQPGDGSIDLRSQGDGAVLDSGGGLRCLFVSSQLDVGGLDEVVVFLALRLRQRGIHVAVLHASLNGTSDGTPTGRLGRLLIAKGIETVELGYAAAIEWLANWRPDVISAHAAPLSLLEAASSLSIPCVEVLHGTHSLFEVDPEVVVKRGRRLDGIVAVSDLIRLMYLKINPTYCEDRIITIPNAVDDSRRKPLDRDKARAQHGIGTEYVFLSLSRHCLQKNTYGLLAAFQDVARKHPQAHLVIAGRPDDELYFAQVMALRDGLECRERIHLRDHHVTPAELFALADGFVLDSFYEGWSLASMEALYAGVPVVLSEVAGAKEQVGTGNERGYLVPNPIGDPLRVNWQTIKEARFARQINRDALVAAMNSLVENRAFWLAQKQRLMRESAERFDPQLCVHRHAEALAAAKSGAPLAAIETSSNLLLT